jgi:hypothetical protein
LSGERMIRNKGRKKKKEKGINGRNFRRKKGGDPQ